MSTDTVFELLAGLVPIGLLFALLYLPVGVVSRLLERGLARDGVVQARENQGTTQVALILAPIGLGVLALYVGVGLDVVGFQGIMTPIATVALVLCGVPLVLLGPLLQIAPFAHRVLTLGPWVRALRGGPADRQAAPSRRQDRSNRDVTGTGRAGGVAARR